MAKKKLLSNKKIHSYSVENAGAQQWITLNKILSRVLL